MDNVAIFWDYENCPVPSSVSGFTVVNNLRTLAQPYGSVRSLKAYLGLTEQPPMPKALTVRSELQSSGVSLVDCPHNGRKDVADKMIIVDMLAHAIDNPAPSTIILITGDRDFAYAISILRLRRYRIILLTLPNAHQSLTAQASVSMNWYEHIIPPNVPIESPNIYEKLLPPGPEQQEFPESDVSPSPCTPLKKPTTIIMQNRQESTGNCVPSTPRKFLHATAPSVDIGKPPLSNVQQSQSSRSGPLQSLRDNGPNYIPQTPNGFHFGSSPSVELAKPQVAIVQPQNQWTDPLQSRRDRIVNCIPPTPKSFNFGTPPSVEIERPPVTNVQIQPPLWTEELLPPFTFTPTQGLPSQEQSSQFRDETKDKAVFIPKNEEFKSQSPLTSPKQNGSPVLKPAPDNSTSPDPGPDTTTTNASDTAASSSTLQESVPQHVVEDEVPVVPLHFEVLVQCLQKFQLKGIFRPLRSTVAYEVGKYGVYRKVGLQKFKQYAAMAQSLGIVDLGGSEGEAWIYLKAKWKNVK